MKQTAKKALNNLKVQFEENPLLVIGVATGVLVTLAKVTETATSARNASTWKKEVKRRERNSNN
jgi:hypothetical protein